MKHEVEFSWRHKTYSIQSGSTPTKSHSVWLEYTSTDVEVEYQVPVVDTPAFISAIGGGLGLYLGFSIIDTLFYIYKWIFARRSCQKQAAQTTQTTITLLGTPTKELSLSNHPDQQDHPNHQNH